MTRGWALVLDHPTADPARQVGGLAVALRLALDAQQAGATAIAAADPATRATLRDVRLRLPVSEGPPADASRLHVRANLVVHRNAFGVLAPKLSRDANVERDLELEPIELQTPFAFSPVVVCDEASARAAEKALLRSLRKVEDGWTARWLNRYISLAITRLLAKTPLRPNQVSIGILAVGLAGAWIATGGGYWHLLAGALLFQAQSVLDGCDGELSRLTHRKSHIGEWLDTIGDDLTNYGFFAGAAWGLFRTSGENAYLLAGLITVGSGIIASGLEYRYLIRIGSGDLLKYPLSQKAASDGRLAAIQPLFKRDTFVLLTLLAALAGLTGPMLFVFAAAAVVILGNVIATEVRLARRRPDRLAPAKEPK